ncbi:hypothetical protein OSCT_1707 [Oscillochloris trichoides DG-6]|uniref:Lipoprotein n=1 Tax=Oscillochloris trichoides DG-6 TaxID=765420 RepID=E1IEF6_9CHLR|nr:hypothetical protein [Oscillochloris trichoides]EFO80482.1 hypothetical protein OSCT_1707 [Oscillochloris trichoides DG-6]
MFQRLLLLVVALGLVGCSTAPTPPSAAPLPAASAVVLGDGRTPDLPAIHAEQERRRAALAAPPYLVLRPGLDARLDAAQRAAAESPQVQAATRLTTGDPLLAEVMAVGAASAGDIPPALADRCPPGTCVRVVIYGYSDNTTLTVLLDAQNQVLDVQSLVAAQPEIPRELADLATQIAISSPVTAAALGLTPTEAMALDYASATKTTMIGTPCERSRHLCVSPVFAWGTQALWVIVDLTDLRLVGASTWTEQGQLSQRRDVSEASLEDAALAPLCETPQLLEHQGWRASYLLTSSDGLELRDVTFQGRPVVQSIKVVDWHVGYAAGSDGRRVGFSDTVGCPVFSSAAIIPYTLPTLTTNEDGSLQLGMTFRSPNWPQACNYQYTMRATFMPDGTLSAEVGSDGRGCGIDGVYHPVLRIAPPAGGSLRLDDGTQATPITQEGFATWPVGDSRSFVIGGVRLAPLWGDAQHAYLYWSRPNPAEGQGDLPSIGTCCNLDHQQGPEQFIAAPEAINSEAVIWYVPSITNAERERCWADMVLKDGVLRPQIWPCHSGVRLTAVGE